MLFDTLGDIYGSTLSSRIGPTLVLDSTRRSDQKGSQVMTLKETVLLSGSMKEVVALQET